MELLPFHVSLESPKDSDPSLLNSHRSSFVNNTKEADAVTFFIIQGLTSLGKRQLILFVILLLGYIIILGGNSIIIFVALTDPKLSSPMYFFLSNLSLVEIIYTTTTIPKMLSSFLSDMTTISVPGCFLQMFFFIQLGATGHAILTVMAFDRYVAICNPLRYTVIMTRHIQFLLIAGAWGFSTLCTLPAAIITWQEPYCGPNVVRHAWCDPASVRRLACADTSIDNLVSLFSALVSLLTTGVLILASYVLIGISISRMGVTQRFKAFGTCAAHLTVVTISYTSASFVYISYRVGNFSPEVRGSNHLALILVFALSFHTSTGILKFSGLYLDVCMRELKFPKGDGAEIICSFSCEPPVRISVAVLYSILIPFLNPIIYSLRNKELQDSIRRTLRRFGSTAVSATKDANSVLTARENPPLC